MPNQKFALMLKMESLPPAQTMSSYATIYLYIFTCYINFHLGLIENGVLHAMIKENCQLLKLVD